MKSILFFLKQKKIICSFAIFLFTFCTVFPMFSFAHAEGELEITAPSAILIEQETGKVLFEKDSHQKLPPASVTKIMTMLLVMEEIDKNTFTLSDMVTCSDFAASMGGSQVYLEPGEQMSVRDMLKALAVASGNDAAVALSEFVAGSNESFVARMNERAKELGMNDTHFVNCNGLDVDEHYSSAYDIALMSRELLKHRTILEFTTIWMDSLRDGKFGLVNTNKLIRFYEGANGLKTGSTSTAKYCLSASAERNNLNLIAVILAAPSSKERFADATKLLDYGFANFTKADNLITEDDLLPIKVLKGEQNIIKPICTEAGGVLISKDKLNSIEKKITLESEVAAPVKKGQKLGVAEFFADGEKIGETEITAEAEVKKITLGKMFIKIMKTMIFGSGDAYKNAF